MNKEAIEQLYQAYVQQGLLDSEAVSLESFSSMNYDQAQQVYKAGVEKELFNVPFDSFSSLFGLDKPIVEEPKKKEDTVSESMDGSLESPEIDEKDISLDSEDSEFIKQFKSKGLATISNITRIPAYLQGEILTLATAFDPEAREALNKLSFEEREAVLGTFAAASGQYAAGPQLREASEQLKSKSDKIAETFKQYDQTISEDIVDLKLGQATARIFAEVGGAIPSIMQIMLVPGAGLVSLGLGSAAEESVELQKEGEDLGLKTSATSVLYGAAEAALETVTRGIGKKFFKSLAGKSDEFVKASIKQFVKETSKDFAKEGSSELGTELLQNLTDYAIQGDEDAFNKALGHYTDIFIIGGFATAPISGSTQGVQITRQTLEKRAIDRKVENSKYDDLVSMFKDPEINKDTEDLGVSNVKKFLKFELDQKVEQGEITREEAEATLKNYEDAVYIKNEFNGLDIPTEVRPEIAKLLLEKKELKSKISGKEPVVVFKEIERFEQIDGEIKSLLESSLTEEVAVEEEVAPETEVAVEEGAAPEVEAEIEEEVEEEGVDEEYIDEDGSTVFMYVDGIGRLVKDTMAGETIYDTREEFDTERERLKGLQAEEEIVDEADARVFVAPFYDTTIENVNDAGELRKSKGYKKHIAAIKNTAKSTGLEIEAIEEGIGGFINEKGTKIREIQNVVRFKPGQDIGKIEEYAAVIGVLTTEVQEATIAAQYVDEQSDAYNSDSGVLEYSIKTDKSKSDEILQALKDNDIYDFTYNESTGDLVFLDFSKGQSTEFNEKISNFAEYLKSKNIQHEAASKRAIESRYIDPQRRKELLSGIARNAVQQGQDRGEFYKTVKEAIRRSNKFLKQTQEVKPTKKKAEPKKKPATKKVAPPKKAVENKVEPAKKKAEPEVKREQGLDRTGQLKDADHQKLTGLFNELQEAETDAESTSSKGAQENLRKAKDKFAREARKMGLDADMREVWADALIIEQKAALAKLAPQAAASMDKKKTAEDKAKAKEAAKVAKLQDDIQRAREEAEDANRRFEEVNEEIQNEKDNLNIAKEEYVKQTERLKKELETLKLELQVASKPDAEEGWSDMVKEKIKRNKERQAEEKEKLQEEKERVADAIEYYKQELPSVRSEAKKSATKLAKLEAKQPKFQKGTITNIDPADVDAVVEQMNELSDEQAAFENPSELTTKKKLNLKSLRDRFGRKVKVVKDIAEFEGIPFMFSISDQLTTGKWTSPFTGKIMEFFGGLGFNMSKGNENNAWANTTEDIAKGMKEIGLDVYNKNKELFDRLWEEGKLPKGHVPMAILKMGQSSIESNEALFRVIADNLETHFTKQEQQIIFEALKEDLKDRAKSTVALGHLNKYDNIIDALNNITEINISNRNIITTRLTYGSTDLGAPTKPSVPQKAAIAGVLELKGEEFYKYLHLPTINASIREEASDGIPDSHVIAITGVDVLNPQVTYREKGEVNHQNYPFGVKGQLIGVLEKPVHMADVFPEAYARVAAMVKENKNRELPTPASAASQAVAVSGAVATMKAFRGAKPVQKINALNTVLGAIKSSFPSVAVVDTKQEFNGMLASPKVSKLLKKGDVVYGFTLNNRIFLNPEYESINTALHEYGHIWVSFLRENNPQLLQKGYDLLEGTEVLERKKKEYPDDIELAKEEALAELIGNRGETLVNASQSKKNKFKEWFNALFEYVKNKIKGFDQMSQEEFSNITLDEFVDGAIKQILLGKDGKELTEKDVKTLGIKFRKSNIDEIVDSVLASTESSRPKKRKATKLREDSEQAIKDKLKKETFRQKLRNVREKTLDRGVKIKDFLKQIGTKESTRASNLYVNKAGASALSDLRVKEAEKKIYDKLSDSEIDTLNELVYIKRIIAINENRRDRGLKPYVGKDNYSEQDARADLREMEITESKFSELSKRADAYFDEMAKNLKMLRDAKLISEEVYQNLKDVEYSPIKTIKYLIPEGTSETEINRIVEMTGMSGDIIKNLSDENKNDIIMDSKWLLSANIGMVSAVTFENKMLNQFYDGYQSASSEIKESLSDYMLDNPVVGKYKNGNLKYKYDGKEVTGYTKVRFVRDGRPMYMVIENHYANKLLDVKKYPGKISSEIGKWTGSGILRFFATGGNPLFIIGNTAVDFTNILFLSDVYSNNKFKGAFNLAKDAVKFFTQKALSDLTGKGGFKETYREYMEYGGGMTYLSKDGLKALQNLTPAAKWKAKGLSWLKGYGNVMSYLGETSEIAFRMSVYEKSKENQIKQYKKDNGVEPKGEALEIIKETAVREARETIDFSQGGDIVKEVDKVFPYLNAATQGFRKGFDYATANPVKFASSMVQLMAFTGSLVSLSMYALISAMDDDDDLEEILNSVSDYEKANYHIIFTGEKDEKGEWKYVRIKKLPTTSVFANIAEHIVMDRILKNKGYDSMYNKDYLFKGLENIAPIIPTFKNVITRNPLLSAMVTYHSNYDFFYDKEVFRAPRGKDIHPTAEGLYDDRVDEIYKAISKGLDPYVTLSPLRSKAFVEKILTSESTNPTIGLIYAGFDAYAKEDKTLTGELANIITRIGESAGKKVTRSTNKNLISFNKLAEEKTQKMIIETDIWKSEQKVYKEIRKKVEDGGYFSQDEFNQMLLENFEPRDFKKYYKKYTTYLKNVNLDRKILDVIYEDTPEVQALMLYNRFGTSLEADEIALLNQVGSAAGRKVSKKAYAIYFSEYMGK